MSHTTITPECSFGGVEVDPSDAPYVITVELREQYPTDRRTPIHVDPDLGCGVVAIAREVAAKLVHLGVVWYRTDQDITDSLALTGHRTVFADCLTRGSRSTPVAIYVSARS
jgi:hypothetical protein